MQETPDANHIRLRSSHSGSWFDPAAVPFLSAALTERLNNRCRGHRGLFVTLTYRRDDYADDRQLYEASQERKDVALLLRKIGRHLKRDLRGKWFCKLEFQQGGWVHWHLIILDVERIEHAELARMWGHGYVWLRKLSPRQIKYCCKYVAKDGACPPWIYGMPTRSVKVCRVSKGFWPDGESGDGDSEKECEPLDPAEWKPIKVRCYRAIGQAIDRAAKTCLMKTPHGSVRRVPVAYVDLVCVLGQLGKLGGHLTRNAWRMYALTEDRLARILNAMAVPAAQRRVGLHLIEPGNRDAVRSWEIRQGEAMMLWECQP